MNKNIKQKIEHFAREYSYLKSLISILDNIIFDDCNYNNKDIENLSGVINKSCTELSKTLDEIEVELRG